MAAGRSAPVWGPGLTLVLKAVPSALLYPALSIVGATLIKRSESHLVYSIPRPALVIIILCSLNIASSWVRKIRRRIDRRRLGPDVEELPQLKLKWPGNLDWFPATMKAIKTGHAGDSWAPHIEKMGNTFNTAVLGQDEIFTSEPENFKSLFATDFPSYEIGLRTRNVMKSILGNGVFNSNGDMWKFHRSMSRPFFSRERIAHFDVFARHSDAAIDKLLSRSAEISDNKPTAVDFQNLVSCFAMDCATEFLFGLDVKSLDAPLPYPHSPARDDASAQFAHAFDGVIEKAVVRFRLSILWPFIEMFWDRTREDLDVIDRYIQPILKEKMRLKAKRSESSPSNNRLTSPKDEETPDTLLDHLALLTDDEKLIRDELLNILLAGRDTTTSVLTFACYMLAYNPSIMVKLRTEILNVVGATSRPTVDEIRSIKYLRAFINEVLRLFPPVPTSSRESVKSTVLRCDGKQYYIPAGADIRVSILMMHRRKDLWGPDAEVFDPERWLDERNKKYVLANPFIFLPFSAGPRICLGQQFAYNETSFFLIRLLQRVESISLAPDAQPSHTLPPPEWTQAKGRKAIEKIIPKAHITLYAAGGLWVRVKEADGN